MYVIFNTWKWSPKKLNIHFHIVVEMFQLSRPQVPWRWLWRQQWLGPLSSACVRRETLTSWKKLGKSSRRKKKWRKVSKLLHFIQHGGISALAPSSFTVHPLQESLFQLVCLLTTACAISPLWRVTPMWFWKMAILSKCKLQNWCLCSIPFISWTLHKTCFCFVPPPQQWSGRSCWWFHLKRGSQFNCRSDQGLS